MRKASDRTRRVAGKTRVTFVIFSLEGGGAQRIMVNMANYWAKAGWEITLITLVDDEQDPVFELNRKITLSPLGVSSREPKPLFRPASFTGFWNLRCAIRKSGPDVVVSFMAQTNVIVLLASLGLGTPVVVSERCDPELLKVGRFWETLRSWVYPMSDGIVVQTSDMKEYFSKEVRDRAVIIPNPVAVPSAYEKVGKTEERRKAVVAMGRLCYQKGFDVLLAAFARIKDKYPEWKLEILGEGPNRQDLESLIGHLGLGGEVRLFGWIKNPYEVLRRAELFVLSSRFEGFPNALTEAMACGLPAISTDCPTGPRDIIRPGVDGILVPPEDKEALAAAMARLMSDEALRSQMASQAVKVRERFGLDKIMAMWEELLTELIDKGRAASRIDSRG